MPTPCRCHADAPSHRVVVGVLRQVAGVLRQVAWQRVNARLAGQASGRRPEAAAALVVKRRREAGRRLRCGPGRPRRGPGRPEAGRRLRRGPGRPRRGPGQRKPGSSPAGFAWQAVAAVARSGRAALSVRPRQPTLARQSSETVSAPQARGVSAGPKARPMIRPPFDPTPLTLPL